MNEEIKLNMEKIVTKVCLMLLNQVRGMWQMKLNRFDTSLNCDDHAATSCVPFFYDHLHLHMISSRPMTDL
jgi:hypothetical protein